MSAEIPIPISSPFFEICTLFLTCRPNQNPTKKKDAWGKAPSYEFGIKDGLNQNPIKNNFDALPESQAGTGRHKDVQQAYLAGYREGASKRTSL